MMVGVKPLEAVQSQSSLSPYPCLGYRKFSRTCNVKLTSKTISKTTIFHREALVEPAIESFNGSRPNRVDRHYNVSRNVGPDYRRAPSTVFCNSRWVSPLSSVRHGALSGKDPTAMALAGVSV
jgi:hypothetical protein